MNRPDHSNRNTQNQTITAEDIELFYKLLGKSGRPIKRVFKDTPTSQDIMKVLGTNGDRYNFDDQHTSLGETTEDYEGEKAFAERSKHAEKILKKVKEIEKIKNNRSEIRDNLPDKMKNLIDDMIEYPDELQEYYNEYIEKNYLSSQFSFKMALKKDIITLDEWLKELTEIEKDVKSIYNESKTIFKSKEKYQKEKNLYDTKYQKAISDFKTLSEGIEFIKGEIKPTFPDSLEGDLKPHSTLHKVKITNSAIKNRNSYKPKLELVIKHVITYCTLNEEEKRYFNNLLTQINDTSVIQDHTRMRKFKYEIMDAYNLYRTHRSYISSGTFKVYLF